MVILMLCSVSFGELVLLSCVLFACICLPCSSLMFCGYSAGGRPQPSTPTPLRSGEKRQLTYTHKLGKTNRNDHSHCSRSHARVRIIHKHKYAHDPYTQTSLHTRAHTRTCMRLRVCLSRFNSAFACHNAGLRPEQHSASLQTSQSCPTLSFSVCGNNVP